MNRDQVRVFTGVGSRGAPQNILDLCEEYSSVLAKLGFNLWTGNAKGCDAAFIKGGDPEFTLVFAPHWIEGSVLSRPRWLSVYSEEAEQISKDLHPNWGACNTFARGLLTRNVYQVLGATLTTPSDFVLFWAPKDKSGEYTGGTSQTLRIAQAYDVPAYQVGTQECSEFITHIIDSYT